MKDFPSEVTVLHVEDDATLVYQFLGKVLGHKKQRLDFDDSELIDNIKKEGEPTDITETGYWWASSLEEAVKCINSFTSANKIIDFVIIDRRLTDTEQGKEEIHELQSSNNKNISQDINKSYLSKEFPWYNEASYTGDFLFLYLTLINKCYLRNIYFLTGNKFDITKDSQIVKIWYNIAQIDFEEDMKSFKEWAKKHFLYKGTNSVSEDADADALIKSISLPHAGICHQFQEALDIFNFVEAQKQTRVIDLKYRNNVINLLLASKQYDGTQIDRNDIKELREGLNQLTRLIAKNIFGSDLKYVHTFEDKSGKQQEHLYKFVDSNENIKPYEVKKALFECRDKRAVRLGYLISFVYHIQSEEVHGGNTDISKVLNNTYTMHTTVFAFMEICRYIVTEILSKDTKKYRKQSLCSPRG